ncbi:uncharacterized protein CLUP02_10318 [Colletotrichum lupini]|uniref:Uncharacterized protein n=1 Tax=Colletotrichum lupini TaxID=145971 RepID=A0A9Q8SWG8_9PEZI|nr:uncharacterized protein CLUP02_10318 [Colletotrichum lupini]UQC84822.1 hypothetical protein CLUP02_10318 [Colletotrichum lupini]
MAFIHKLPASDICYYPSSFRVANNFHPWDILPRINKKSSKCILRRLALIWQPQHHHLVSHMLDIPNTYSYRSPSTPFQSPDSRRPLEGEVKIGWVVEGLDMCARDVDGAAEAPGAPPPPETPGGGAGVLRWYIVGRKDSVDRYRNTWENANGQSPLSRRTLQRSPRVPRPISVLCLGHAVASRQRDVDPCVLPTSSTLGTTNPDTEDTSALVYRLVQFLKGRGDVDGVPGRIVRRQNRPADGKWILPSWAARLSHPTDFAAFVDRTIARRRQAANREPHLIETESPSVKRSQAGQSSLKLDSPETSQNLNTFSSTTGPCDEESLVPEKSTDPQAQFLALLAREQLNEELASPALPSRPFRGIRSDPILRLSPHKMYKYVISKVLALYRPMHHRHNYGGNSKAKEEEQ